MSSKVSKEGIKHLIMKEVDSLWWFWSTVCGQNKELFQRMILHKNENFTDMDINYTFYICVVFTGEGFTSPWLILQVPQVWNH